MQSRHTLIAFWLKLHLDLNKKSAIAWCIIISKGGEQQLKLGEKLWNVFQSCFEPKLNIIGQNIKKKHIETIFFIKISSFPGLKLLFYIPDFDISQVFHNNDETLRIAHQTDLCSEHPMSPIGGSTALPTHCKPASYDVIIQTAHFLSAYKCRLLWKLDLFPKLCGCATSICWFLLWNCSFSLPLVWWL